MMHRARSDDFNTSWRMISKYRESELVEATEVEHVWGGKLCFAIVCKQHLNRWNLLALTSYV